MQRKPLGRTGLEVTTLCLGTMTWGQQNSEAEGHAQLDYAMERGIDFIDTAELYAIPPKAETQGSTERIIGTWMKARRNRSDVILATKIVGRSGNTWFRDDGSPTELSRAQIVEAVDKSLQRLQTDYIDLYQIHWPDRSVSQFGANPVVWKPSEPGPEHPVEETLEILGELVTAGKIRHVGLSNESAWGTMTYLKHAEAKGLPRVASIQNAYSLINRTFETALAEVAMREDVGLLAYSALGQGYLTGKYEGGARPAGARLTLFDRMQRYQTPGAPAAITAYVDLARKWGLDPAQMALAWAASRPFMTSVIIGATSVEQLKANIDALAVTISPELEAEIDAIHLRHTNPCP
ncbi:aldo/keto reductase [Salinarimonas ramus]|uniref:Protein tas n=1 Tax=Salinarimonas ramus TaxID=690164 RepID=A0A917Q9P1_9HYPH|nr:aldo/keto reductase [Salinarimonas ramus]GGK37493.1 NADP-dependent oxidoreductase [Salinarimonas ramus]